jgi:capsular polysaccharide biosynthesis protein
MPGRASDSWFIHPNDQERLFHLGEQLELKSRNQTGQDLIYISRVNSPRSLPGESQLEDLLRNKGFFIAHSESVPWKDQISLFRHAKVVVGPHGAGLSNLVFSQPEPTLVELTNGFHYNRCFEWITHVVGQTYSKIDANAALKSLRADQFATEILKYV